MFNWSKKKPSQKRGRPNRQSSDENEFGVKIDKGQDDKQLEAELKRLAGVDSLPDDEVTLNEGEEDEEAELLRLLGQSGKGKRPPKKSSAPDEQLGEIGDLTADLDLGDEDVEVDENDPDLLGELMELTNPEEEVEMEDEEESEAEDEEKPANGASDILSVLKERLKMYKTAEAKAKEGKESSRARRFARGIKTLEDLLKKAKAGKAIAEADIPPVIAMNLKPAPPPQPQPEMPTEMNGNVDETTEVPEEGNFQQSEEPGQSTAQENQEPVDVLTTLIERLKLYQAAEAKAKSSGETTRARRFSRGIKTIEGLIKQAKAGKPVAVDDIPPAVALNLKPAPPPPPPEAGTSGGNEEQVEHEMSNINLTSSGEDSESKGSDDVERNIMDVLSERLNMYKTAVAKAKESGETSRARRFERGIKTLQTLIREATAGKPIANEDIPPVIALNLKPAPPVVMREDESEVGQPSIERENLVQSTPIAFNPVDDVDLDEELEEVEETPRTVLEGLEQRLRIYSKCHERAKEEGNEALAIQNGKIARVYANAIKTFKSGGYVDVLKLPNPNGCPPIPIPFYVP